MEWERILLAFLFGLFCRIIYDKFFVNKETNEDEGEDFEYPNEFKQERIEWPSKARVIMPFIDDEFEFISGDSGTFSIQLNNEEQYAILTSSFIGEDREPNFKKFPVIRVENEDKVYVVYGVGLHYFSQNMMGTFVCFNYDYFEITEFKED